VSAAPLAIAAAAGHALLLLVSPIFVVGVINRVKSRWGGRVGPSLHQSWFDLLRLLRKRPVQSTTASWLVQLGPLVLLASTLLAGCLTPLAAGWAPVRFDYDFVAFAYLLGLGRLFLVLAALDTGSAFEGMGASREAQYATFVEPAFFLAVGSLAALSGETSFAALLTAPERWTAAAVLARAGALVALFVTLQVEAARVPVDDPQTHLELTMIHEVMVLDHSGPDLAAVQYAAAVKLTLCAAVIAALLSPLPPHASPWLAVPTSLLLTGLVAALVGLIESLIARFRLLALPYYLLVAVLAGLVSLGVVALTRGPLA
jgi:formate hydrogenlyase subunit 4